MQFIDSCSRLSLGAADCSLPNGMSQQDKLIQRIRSKPKDFTWRELKRLLAGFGYSEEAGSGSRRKFIHHRKAVSISLHQPHSGNTVKAYQVKDVFDHLKQEGYL